MKKLEYKVIHEGVDFTKEANFLDTILESNGVENIDAFLKGEQRNRVDLQD